MSQSHTDLSTVYLVTKEGVYRHDILGAFLSEGEAREAADRAIRAEHDSYHNFDVLRMAIGIPGEHRICTYQRTDKTHWEKQANSFGRVVVDSVDINVLEHRSDDEVVDLGSVSKETK